MVNLASDSDSSNSLLIDYRGSLTYENTVDTILTAPIGRNYSFCTSSSPWVHTSTVIITAGQYASLFYYADTKASKAYPPYSIATSSMPHVRASGGGWSSPGYGQYVPIAASPIRKLAIISSAQSLTAGTTSQSFGLQTQDRFSNPSPIRAGEEPFGEFDLASNSPGSVQFASPSPGYGWNNSPVMNIAHLGLGDDTTTFWMIDTKVGEWQVFAENPEFWRKE